jgi:cyclase
MGLAVRIIPTILSKNGQLVKGKRFASDRVVGHALQASRIHNARGVDELCFFDVGATTEGRGPDLKLIEELTRDVFSPVTYGGGIRSVEDVRAVLAAGADKVAICTGSSRVIAEAAPLFGSQAIVGTIDCVKTHMTYVACGKISGYRMDRHCACAEI